MNLDGVIDLHVHAAPDVRPRKMDYLELAQTAQTAGMRGFVLKNHHSPTIAAASILRRVVPGLEVFGGLVLNEAIGGLNPTAVEAALKMGGAVIWMPTLDAAHERTYHGQFGTGIRLLDDDGDLFDSVHEILRLIAEKEAILALGHISPAEMMATIAAGREAGVNQIVINHPGINFLNLLLDQQRALAKPGVYFERCYVRSNKFATNWDSLVASIREIGVASTVLGTDLGQADGPDPVNGMKEMLTQLFNRGITCRELDIMARRNPANLLGLR